MTDWQPIDTAPRDGTLAFYWVGGDCPQFGRWYAGDLCPLIFDGYGDAEYLMPTHWMPLQSPPNE